jgi:hypothetical protein
MVAHARFGVESNEAQMGLGAAIQLLEFSSHKICSAKIFITQTRSMISVAPHIKGEFESSAKFLLHSLIELDIEAH